MLSQPKPSQFRSNSRFCTIIALKFALRFVVLGHSISNICFLVELNFCFDTPCFLCTSLTVLPVSFFFFFPGHVKGLRPGHWHLLQHRGLSHLLRLLRPHRSVRPGQCGHRCPDEAPGGEQQGSQRGGGARGGDGTGEQSSDGGNGVEVSTAQPSGSGHGPVQFWRLPLEVQRRTGHRRADGLTNRWHTERLYKHQCRRPFVSGAPTGGEKYFFIKLQNI